jgi:hypothetical protein
MPCHLQRAGSTRRQSVLPSGRAVPTPIGTSLSHDHYSPPGLKNRLEKKITTGHWFNRNHENRSIFIQKLFFNFDETKNNLINKPISLNLLV